MDDNELGHLFAMAEQPRWEALGRYLEGRCTPEEAREVEASLAEDPERQELVRRAARARLAVAAAPGLWCRDEAWTNLVAREGSAGETRPAAAQEPEGAKEPRGVVPLRPAAKDTRRGWRTGRPLLRMAAALVLLAGSTILWQQRATLLELGAGSTQEFVTGVGERVRLTLGDGSQVVLGPHSRLEFPERFGRTRSLHLEGEAVFDVASDSSRPFLVHSGGATTRVLGTRFGVRAYPEDEYVEVVVAEGRVAVSTADGEATSATEPSVLTPGQALRVGSDGVLTDPRQVDAERLLAWTTDRLYFDDTPLYEVARTLDRRYGVTLELPDPGVAALRLTAEFRQPTALDIVRLISLSLGIEYRKTDAGFQLFHPAQGVDRTREDGGSMP